MAIDLLNKEIIFYNKRVIIKAADDETSHAYHKTKRTSLMYCASSYVFVIYNCLKRTTLIRDIKANNSAFNMSDSLGISL